MPEQRAAVRRRTWWAGILSAIRLCARGDFGLANEYGAMDDFMVLALGDAALPAGGGLVRYGEEFRAFGYSAKNKTSGLRRPWFGG